MICLPELWNCKFLNILFLLSGVPGTRQTVSDQRGGESVSENGGQTRSTPSLAKSSSPTLPVTTTINSRTSKFVPTDHPPTVPLKGLRALSPNEVEKRKLGAYYRTVYTGNGTKSLQFNASESPDGRPADNMTTHISGTQTTVSAIQEQALPPAGYGLHQRPGYNGSRPTRVAGPYFRPPSAISHKYKNFRIEPGDKMADIDPDCWPHCRNSTRGWGSKRKRKHSSFKKRKYYNYKLLYDTLKVNFLLFDEVSVIIKYKEGDACNISATVRKAGCAHA